MVPGEVVSEELPRLKDTEFRGSRKCQSQWFSVGLGGRMEQFLASLGAEPRCAQQIRGWSLGYKVSANQSHVAKNYQLF